MYQQLSSTEENYLKAIFKLSENIEETVSTNSISALMQTTAASVTDMIKRLSEKELVHYEKYKGVILSEIGLKIATSLVRKHRLWETFLVNKLYFSWDEIHEIAEQLEHVHSEILIDRLDAFLDYPKFDPHGDPIPDKEGKFTDRHQWLISDLDVGITAVVVGVKDHSSSFLQYLDKLGLTLGTSVFIAERYDYDQSVKVIVKGSEKIITQKVCNNLYLKP